MLSRECGSYADEMRESAAELDLRGLNCPLPVLRTRKALRRLGVGETILVLCTDPLAVVDIPHLVRCEGQELRAQSIEGGVASFLIAKTASPLA